VFCLSTCERSKRTQKSKGVEVNVESILTIGRYPFPPRLALSNYLQHDSLTIALCEFSVLGHNIVYPLRVAELYQIRSNHNRSTGFIPTHIRNHLDRLFCR